VAIHGIFLALVLLSKRPDLDVSPVLYAHADSRAQIRQADSALEETLNNLIAYL
jgi:hypothetical protein